MGLLLGYVLVIGPKIGTAQKPFMPTMSWTRAFVSVLDQRALKKIEKSIIMEIELFSKIGALL